jgi:ceramide glucosyltransferase
MSAPALAFLAGLALSALLYSASAVILVRWISRERGRTRSGFEPAVSILKPLRGLDDGLEENLESFFRLDYPAYELVFSLASPEDPAYAVARRAADRHPAVASTFVFDPRERGGNAKVNRLEAAVGHARHRMLLLSDGNVRVRPDFLRRAVSWFEDSRVGLVSHLFFATGARGLASRLESLYLNGCSQSGTLLVARALRMPCVVGKSILVSRGALDAMGGLARLRDFLAEDFLLGREVRRAGYRVVLSGDAVETTEMRKSAGAVWARHRRWAMMRRRLGGALYAGEALSSPFVWAFAAVLNGGTAALGWAIGFLALRYATESAVLKRAGVRPGLLDGILFPVRDLGAAVVFVAGLTGRSVTWRGRPMRIGRETLILRPQDVLGS